MWWCVLSCNPFLLSSNVGIGVGLNLTRANHVISLDLAWSRAVESQAWDRAHRLGQTRPVDVQRLVVANTVEDRIIALQDRKVRSMLQHAVDWY